MKTLKRIFVFYYALCGKWLFLLVAIQLCATVLESVGITALFPILRGFDDSSGIAGLFAKGFNAIGIQYTLINLLIVFLLLIVFRSIFFVTQMILTTWLKVGVEKKLFYGLMERYFEIAYQKYLGLPSGKLNNVLIREVRATSSTFSSLSSLVVSFLLAVCYCTMPMVVNPRMTFMLIVLSIFCFVFMRIIIKQTKKISMSLTERNLYFQNFLLQILYHIKYVKGVALESKVYQKIVVLYEAMKKMELRQGVYGSLSVYAFDPFMAVFVVVAIYYHVGINKGSGIEIIFILALLVKAFRSFSACQDVLRKILSQWGSIFIVEEYMKKLKDFAEERRPKIVQEDSVSKTIRFEQVSFQYDRDTTGVLNNVSLKIDPCTSIAFVGESGVGKTTMVNLMIGLLKPTSGNIFLGDDNYAVINQESFRKLIGYVTQEGVVFNDTVFNNVTLWDSFTDDNFARFRTAIECAGALFIDEFPDKERTVLGEKGSNISGGQLQRLCIARELYRNKKILIFDEATSSLDSETEKEIQKSIMSLHGVATIIIIAHRLSTIRNVDCIHVLENGAIVESGTYNELCQKNGSFARMIKTQFLE